MSSIEIPAGRAVRGSVQVPPSKSVTHRVLLLSLLLEDTLRVERPLVAEDTEYVIEALRACGRRIERSGEVLVSAPAAEREPSLDPLEIDCGSSATLLRLLLGVLAARPGYWVLDGTEQLRRRPVGPLVDALRGQGIEVKYLAADGLAPLAVRGGRLPGGRAVVDASLSSQYLSAMILAGLTARTGLEVEVRGLTSAPYVDLTLEYVRHFGGRVDVRDGVYRVSPGLRPPANIRVEGDYSSAAYFAAAAVLTGGEVRLAGLRADSAQADRSFLDLLVALGGVVEFGDEGVIVQGGDGLGAIDVDMRDMPDQVPTLAALAPFAHGTTRITGVPHLRLKESDRLAAMTRELERVGGVVVERHDGLEIPGVWASGRVPGSTVRVDAHGDHRIAMSMAVHGLRRSGLRIERPEVVAKSFPRFWEQFLGMLAD